MYSYSHPVSFNPAVITNKIYGNINNETGSLQAAGFHKKTISRKFLSHQPDALDKCN